MFLVSYLWHSHECHQKVSFLCFILNDSKGLSLLLVSLWVCNSQEKEEVLTEYKLASRALLQLLGEPLFLSTSERASKINSVVCFFVCSDLFSRNSGSLKTFLCC